MNKLNYNIKQRKKASTLQALSSSEISAVDTLIEKELYRECVVHLYFASFYLSQAILLNSLSQNNPSHKAVDSTLNRMHGRSRHFPRRYVRMHSELHSLRTEVDYRSAHTPEIKRIIRYLKLVKLYCRFVDRHIEEIGFQDILKDIFLANDNKVKDFSIDIYCPKTYSHHVRFSLWMPPFYLGILKIENLNKHIRDVLKMSHVKNSGNYVAGLNSRLNQYDEHQLLMLDIDSLSSDVEFKLKEIGGILLKSGRGYHFIGRQVITSNHEWRKRLRKILRDPILKQRIDHKHILISIKRGYSTLRMTTSPAKPVKPQFFKEF
jgi:uncharacterized protein (UPF0332 family)